ncbi:MAG: 2-oxoacid:acceptor oxidoreductase family protein [bacterium JZ-2024 1]
MREVIIAGRAGQGAITVAALMAMAGFREGWYPLAFPHFGAERMGAPMNAYIRFDRKPIQIRSAIELPDDLIVLDPSLFRNPADKPLVKEGGTIFFPQEKVPNLLRKKGTVVALPALEMAEQYLGTKQRAGIVLLGAYSAFTGLFSLQAVREAIFERFHGEIAERNWKTAQAGYNWLYTCGKTGGIICIE